MLHKQDNIFGVVNQHRIGEELHWKITNVHILHKYEQGMP